MTDVIVVTHPHDGWIIGVFRDEERARQHVDEECEHLDSYEPDYWSEKLR